jgi:integrase
MFRRLAEAEGIAPERARVSPHTCRHYFAVQWTRQRPDVQVIVQRPDLLSNSTPNVALQVTIQSRILEW